MGFWAIFYLCLTGVVMILAYFSKDISQQKCSLTLFTCIILFQSLNNEMEPSQLRVVLYSIMDLLGGLYVLYLWVTYRNRITITVAFIFLAMVSTHVSFIAAQPPSAYIYNLTLNILYLSQCITVGIGSLLARKRHNDNTTSLSNMYSSFNRVSTRNYKGN